MAAAPPMRIEGARLVSRFGVRSSRRDGSPHMHAGIDISTGRRGDPVFAVKGGTVELVTADDDPRGMAGYGNAVVIRHADAFTLYAHLARVLVTQGQTVTAGQQIGFMGNTTNGQFSPLTGQNTAEWETRARARGYRSGPMVPHLHFEVRRPRPDGSSPFPGPYPQSPDQAQFNIDPLVWMRQHGMTFSRRGGIVVEPGSAADNSRASWEPLHQAGTALPRGALAGLGGLGQAKGGGSSLPATTTPPGLSRGLPEPGLKVPGGYEPVAFERDPGFGLTPTEWALAAAGGIITVGGIVAVVVRRRRMAPNARKSRLRYAR